MTEINTAHLNAASIIATAQAALRIEAQGVTDLIDRVDGSMVQATALILACTGRVVVSGMGKSGHIARKIAATLASTGTPAFFVHPAEAAHGDLGMVTAQDVLIALSNSGTTEELMAVLPSIRRVGASIIAMTGKPSSALASIADVHLNTAVAKEACPLDLAPTASTTAALAMGDALAMAVLNARGFTPTDFARSHPGGALGRKLLTHVRDVMRSGDALPVVQVDTLIPAALMEMTRKGMGMTAVVNADQTLAGIFTDGDVRRAIERLGDVRTHTVASSMGLNPLTIAPHVMAVDAARLMDEQRSGHLGGGAAHARFDESQGDLMHWLTVPLFWLSRFVRARLMGWGFVAVLAVVAFFSARLALDTQHKAPRELGSTAKKHATDFTAKQFTVWRSSLDGATQYRLTGESITHYRDDLSSVIVKPLVIAKTQLTSPKPNQHRSVLTTITAGHGLIRNDGELIQLTRAVKVQRKTPDAALSTLQSDSLVLLPDTDAVLSRSAVTLTLGKHQSIAKGGLDYAHADAELQLIGPVRTTLTPRPQ
jgi:arabinose-5-phosphate isomerase